MTSNDGWISKLPAYATEPPDDWPKAATKPHTPEGGRKLDGKIYLYYQCTDCEATLDPNTTRFAELNNCAMNSEWKIRWSADGSGYNPFCPVCAKARWIGD